MKKTHMCNLRMESHGYSNSCSSLEFDSFDHHIFWGMNRLIIGQHLLHEGLKPQDHLNQVHLMGFWSGFKSPLSTQLEDQIACGKEVNVWPMEAKKSTLWLCSFLDAPFLMFNDFEAQSNSPLPCDTMSTLGVNSLSPQ